MAKVNFYLKDKNKDGSTAIVMFVSFNRQRIKYPTSKSVHPKFWNAESMRVRSVKALPEAKQINNSLENLSKSAVTILYELENSLKRFPTKEEYIKKLDRELDVKINRNEMPSENQPIETVSFIGWYKKFINDSKTGIRLNSGKRFDERSIQKYEATLAHLKEFNKKFYLSFENINAEFHAKFTEFLNKKGFMLNTVGKHIQVLKTFLNYATELGINNNLYYKSRSFKTFNEEAFSIYLNEDELKKIYSHDFSDKPHLERQRDLFIAGCWTGLRFSDLNKLDAKRINGQYLTVKTDKTGETVVIPIHPIVKEIHVKYKDKYESGFPPALTNQKMNEYLKKICKAVKDFNRIIDTEFTAGGVRVSKKMDLHDLVTTHTARRSFATNLYLSGFPSISIMKITGHRTEKAFLKYIKITPEENAKKLLEHWNKNYK
jgi:integrase